MLKRYPVIASGFHLIGKETERGWEQSEDTSTLLPSLMRYQNCSVAGEQLRQRLLHVSLDVLERETGLSRHTILRARQGKQVQARSLELLTLRFWRRSFGHGDRFTARLRLLALNLTVYLGAAGVTTISSTIVVHQVQRASHRTRCRR